MVNYAVPRCVAEVFEGSGVALEPFGAFPADFGFSGLGLRDAIYLGSSILNL